MDDTFDLENAIQTKAELSSATATMDKIGGMGRGKLGGIEVRGKDVDLHESCDLQRSKQHARVQAASESIMEAVNWVCDDALDDHVWVSERAISCQDAKRLQYDLANPCIVQWGMLWLFGTNKSQSEIIEQWSDPSENTTRRSVWLLRVLAPCSFEEWKQP